MDNQKPNDGSSRDVGREGAGSSMGKDMGSSGAGSSGGISGSPGSMGGSAGGMSGTPGGGLGGMGKQDMSKSAADIHKTIDKAAEAAQPMVDRLASGAHQGVDKVTGALTGASARVDEKTRQLGEAYKHFAETGREYVRSSPATSVLVAIGVGYTISRLLGRRR